MGLTESSAVSALGQRLKSLFETRQWGELEATLGGATLWFVDRPLLVSEAMAMANETLSTAKDVELALLRILRSETSETEARGSYLCRLGWYDEARVEQHEVSFEIHIGFGTEDGVEVRYVGVTRERMGLAPDLEESAPAKPPLLAGAPAGDYVTVYAPVFVPASVARGLIDRAREPEA